MRFSQRTSSTAGLALLEVVLAIAVAVTVIGGCVVMVNALASLNTYSGVTTVGGGTVPFAPSEAMNVQAQRISEQIRVDGAQSLYVLTISGVVPPVWGGQTKSGGTTSKPGRLPFLASATIEQLESSASVTALVRTALQSVGQNLTADGSTVFFVGADQVLVSCLRLQTTTTTSDDGIPVVVYSVYRECSNAGVWQQTEGYTFAEKQGVAQFVPPIAFNTDSLGNPTQGRTAVFALPDPFLDVAEMLNAGASTRTGLIYAFQSP